MNRGEMRDFLRTAIFDTSQTFLDDPQANTYLNAAQQHVANLLVAQDERHLLAGELGETGSEDPTDVLTIQNSGSKWYVITPARLPVRRIIEAYRTDLGEDYDDPSLEIIDIKSAKAEHGAAGSSGLKERPPVFVYNQQLGFVQPVHNIKVRVFYTYGIPDMAEDGDVSMLPLEFHLLVPLFAASLALVAENSDSTGTQAMLMQAMQAAGLGVTERADTPED
jgi:hypothetical protein